MTQKRDDMTDTNECKWLCEDGVVPCDWCTEVDEHTCHADGEEYGPYACPIHGEDDGATEDS